MCTSIVLKPERSSRCNSLPAQILVCADKLAVACTAPSSGTHTHREGGRCQLPPRALLPCLQSSLLLLLQRVHELRTNLRKTPGHRSLLLCGGLCGWCERVAGQAEPSCSTPSRTLNTSSCVKPSHPSQSPSKCSRSSCFYHSLCRLGSAASTPP